MNLKYKNQFEDIKEKLLTYQDMNLRLNDQIKNLEDKNSNTKYQLSAIRNVIRDKNNEITNLKDELISIELFKNEKDRTEKSISNLTKNLTNMKEDLERKAKRLREAEKLNTELKLKSDEYFIENQLIKKDNPEKSYIDMLKEKEKKNRILDEENQYLKKEILKINPEFEFNFRRDSIDFGNFDKSFNKNLNGKFFFYFLDKSQINNESLLYEMEIKSFDCKSDIKKLENNVSQIENINKNEEDNLDNFSNDKILENNLNNLNNLNEHDIEKVKNLELFENENEDEKNQEKIINNDDNKNEDLEKGNSYIEINEKKILRMIKRNLLKIMEIKSLNVIWIN